MNRNDEANDEKVAARYIQALQQAAQTVDDPTQRRLDKARRVALDQLTEPRGVAGLRRFVWHAPWVSGGIAAAMLVAALVVLVPDRAMMPSPEDMELLTTDAELEMYENIEFAMWLDRNPLRDEG